MSNLLKKSNRKRMCLDIFIGGIIGAIVFIMIFGVSTLNVTYDSWIFRGFIEDDIIQSYAGWMFYRNSAWDFPIAIAQNMSAPIGSCVAFMDPNPLLCVALKLFAPLLPQTFQYFGWHNFLNFIFMGIAANLLIRHFKINRLLAAIGTALFVFAPIFLERAFRHTALGSQYLVVFALLFYFKARHEAKFPYIGFLVLCTASMGIHAYFVPMIYAVLAAALIDKIIKNKKFALKAAMLLGICFVGTLGMSGVLGMLTRGGASDPGGYGVYNMNLNALINPSSFNYFSITRKLDWSAFLPMQPQIYRNYEGFNYLGFGVILALLFMLVYFVYSAIKAKQNMNKAFFANVKSAIITHLPLMTICFALTIFAVSNVFNFGESVLFKISLPDVLIKLGNMFRASGRMFWVCQYLILLSIVIFFAHRLKPKFAVVALAAITAVQIADVYPTLATKHEYFSQYPVVSEDIYHTDAFKFISQNYNNVYCLGNIFDYRFAAGFIKNNPDINTNIVLANRGGFEYLEIKYIEMQEELKSGVAIADDTIYICTDYETFAGIMASAHPNIKGYKIGDYYYMGNPKQGCPIKEYTIQTEAQND